MSDVPLTKEQRDFAAEQHGLIYSFLHAKGLPEAEYYDIVVFGFLRAVKRYLEIPSLRKYAFSTIAWSSMGSSFMNHYKSQNRQMRKGYTVSLHSVVYGDELLSLEEVLSGPDRLMADFEEKLLLHELAAKVSRQQMEIVRQRMDGYCLREIAKEQHTTIQQIKALLEDIYTTLVSVCYE